MKVALQPITPLNALQFKAVRLQALNDTPNAFGSTYAKESQLSDADWLKRAADWNSERSIGYLAMDAGVACGIVAGFLDEHDPLRVNVISMWVAPSHRRAGVGRSLIDAICAWARDRGARQMHLMVTSVNHPAMEFYKQIGFAMTGNAKPYSNDPKITEYEMARSVDAI